jgi:hypothetical protein
MELKNFNPNNDNVVASNLSNIDFFLRKIVKIKLKNKYHMLFFLQDALISCKKNKSYYPPHKSTLSESKLSW